MRHYQDGGQEPQELSPVQPYICKRKSGETMLNRRKLKNANGKRVCKKCNIEYELNKLNFNTRGKYIDGDIIYHELCRNCRSPKVKTGSVLYQNPYNENGELICTCCKLYFPEENFGLGSHRKNRNNKSTYCKNCALKDSKTKADKYKGTFDYAIRNMNSRIKKKIKTGKNYNKELVYELDIDFLKELYNKQDGKCAISGLPLTYEKSKTGKGGIIPTNMSLDRIDNSKGYRRDNVQLLCTIINVMKHTSTEDELLIYCNAIIKNNKKK